MGKAGRKFKASSGNEGEAMMFPRAIVPMEGNRALVLGSNFWPSLAECDGADAIYLRNPVLLIVGSQPAFRSLLVSTVWLVRVRQRFHFISILH